MAAVVLLRQFLSVFLIAKTYTRNARSTRNGFIPTIQLKNQFHSVAPSKRLCDFHPHMDLKKKNQNKNCFRSSINRTTGRLTNRCSDEFFILVRHKEIFCVHQFISVCFPFYFGVNTIYLAMNFEKKKDSAHCILFTDSNNL